MLKRMILLMMLGLAILPAGPLLAAEGAPAGEHAAAAAEEGTGSLLPDMASKDTYYSAMWVLIIFIVLLCILYPTAWRNVLEGLKKREERIRSDIAEAEATRAKAEQTLKDYAAQLASAEAKSREMIAAASTQGEKLAAQIRTRAEQEAVERSERATKDIEAARDAAIREVHNQAAELSTMIAEKIIRRNLSAADQQDLVQEALGQLDSIRN
jgi:F-type H+-transporting ATPase subunit b